MSSEAKGYEELIQGLTVEDGWVLHKTARCTRHAPLRPRTLTSTEASIYGTLGGEGGEGGFYQTNKQRREGYIETSGLHFNQKRSGGSEVAVTSGRHAQNDKERQQWTDSDIRKGLKDPESDVA